MCRCYQPGCSFLKVLRATPQLRPWSGYCRIIIEWSGLQGTVKILLFQSPWQVGQDTFHLASYRLQVYHNFFDAGQDTLGVFRVASACGWVMWSFSSTNTHCPFPQGCSQTILCFAFISVLYYPLNLALLNFMRFA